MVEGTSTRSVPVAPDSVRVWRGFRLTQLSQEVFFGKLGSIFMPGTVQIQAPVGLTAYLPSVLPAEKHPAAPDEIAVVFYEYQNAYHEAKETVGGRAYSDLHGLVFDLDRSTSGFPVLFDGKLEAEMRYHLFEEHVDWQNGSASTFVGVRSGGSGQEFLDAVADWLKGVQDRGDGLDGAIAVASPDYVVYWEHRPEGAGAGSGCPGLADLAQPVYQQVIPSHPLPERLWDTYPGIPDVAGGESFNFQFQRRKEMT